METTSGKQEQGEGRERALTSKKDFQNACTEMHADCEPGGARASQMDTELQCHWRSHDIADQLAGDGPVMDRYRIYRKNRQRREMGCLVHKEAAQIYGPPLYSLFDSSHWEFFYSPPGEHEVNETSFKKLETTPR